jgi:Na+-translocating ferredoxin:NAD+ oxidoreductase RnfE subunit
MLSRINSLAHPKMIATETTINTNDVSVASQNMAVPAKFRLASAVIMVATIATIIAIAMSNKVTIDMHQVIEGRIIDLGIHGHTTCHPRKS